jgi:hypothetical protein
MYQSILHQEELDKKKKEKMEKIKVAKKELDFQIREKSLQQKDEINMKKRFEEIQREQIKLSSQDEDLKRLDKQTKLIHERELRDVQLQQTRIKKFEDR